MSKKKKRPVPVQAPKKENNTVFSLSSVEATRLEKPYQVVRFRTGAHKGKKDRPRDNNWRKWDME
jgi:hypothetical protein